jgi:cell division transport system permease protein
MKLPHYIENYLARHAQVALNSLGRLYRAPLGSFLTAAVLGIALALPAALYLLTANLQRLSTQWDGNSNISLFLRDAVSAAEAEELAHRLRSWPAVQSVQLITPEQALIEFRELSEFGEVLDALEDNPLPTVVAIEPAQTDSEAAAALLAELRELPEVDLAQLDLQWVKRLQAILDIVHRSIWVLATLLGLAVVLIVGNTIRLEIQNRHAEIEITKLIGATDGFIRRPFLYSGFWYGVAGAVLALILVELAFFQLHRPVRELAGLYQSDFTLKTLSLGDTAALIAAGALLGLLGAALAVGRHLAVIEPDSLG